MAVCPHHPAVSPHHPTTSFFFSPLSDTRLHHDLMKVGFQFADNFPRSQKSPPRFLFTGHHPLFPTIPLFRPPRSQSQPF
ncbi:hypothetical protein L1887_34776 [Cichorium endivia]|nr:hypothetical protein L1887_34776 [Cichorium endivia]